VDSQQLKQEVRKASRGDERAAALLFDRYHPRVYRYALAKLQDPVDAEDVAAETFARVVRELPRFRWRAGGFEPWIFRIAYRLVVDHTRRSARELPTDEIPSTASTDEHTPETRALESELRDDLAARLDSLPPDQREVLMLRFAGGLGTTEVAKIMRRKPNAVRQLQFRALESMRARISEEVEL
jgi:RNA polymerase sigma-70 factor, ECF subfamily